MDTQEFTEFGRAAIDFLADYTDNIRNRNVLPNVEPGYLSVLMPKEAPQKADKWQDLLKDFEAIIMPGITHWSSPHFHAYYPTANSYPAVVGELLSAGLGCLGFSWICSPACTELEVVMMNWLGKLLGLSEEFLNCSEGPGGGVIQGSASETTLVCLLAAKERTTRRIKALHPDWDEGVIRSKLVAYTSDQSNSSVEKAGLLGAVPMKFLQTDDKYSLRGDTLRKTVEKDLEDGLIPCYVVATLGTTGTCAFDNLNELGAVCKEFDLWLHVDAAYAGAAFVCPEFRYLMSGVEHADSFNFNPHKWLLVNFDCSALWYVFRFFGTLVSKYVQYVRVKDSTLLIDAFNVDRIYLKHDKQGLAPDYRNWQIPLGRRFRALKLWFVLRLYGVEGLQQHIRHTIKLARLFEQLVLSDDRFEIVTDVSMGLICFRMKGDNSLTKELLSRLTERKRIYVIAATFKEKLIVRFVVCSRLSEEKDLLFAWKEITEQTTEILLSRQRPLQENSTDSIKKVSDDIASRIENLNLETKISSQKIS